MNKIKELKEKQEQLQKELKIVTDELNLLQKKGIRKAEEVYLGIKNLDQRQLENVGIIVNKNDSRQCKIYTQSDIGGYNNIKTGCWEIDNCNDEDYELLKQLPHCLGIKETKFFNERSEFGGEYTYEIFLKWIGLTW